MPIQFQCPHCGHGMQLPDAAAGKQGKCPKCQGVVTVPAPAAAPAPMNPHDEEFWSEVGEKDDSLPQQEEQDPHGGEKQSDAQLLKMHLGRVEEDAKIQRTGLPWESSDEGFFDRYWDTTVALTNHPSDTWATMRLKGGLGSPFKFLLIGAIFGSFFNALYAVFREGINGLAEVDINEIPQDIQVKLAIAFVVLFLIAWVMGIIGSLATAYAQAGILMLTSAMVGIKGATYETSFRVSAFAYGTMLVWTVVPVLGSLFGLIVWVVTLTIGVAATYNTSRGAAFGAVFLSLLPLPIVLLMIILMLGLILGLLFTALGVAAAIAGAAT